MRCVKHIQTVWKSEYCSPAADPALSQTDSINIHKLVWPFLVGAALSFSKECAACVYMCGARGLRPRKAYILDAGCRMCNHQPPPPPSFLLTRRAEKTLTTQLCHLKERGTENVLQVGEMSEEA